MKTAFTPRTAATILLVAAAGLVHDPAAAQSGAQSILVLDASGSMWGQLDGRTKIELARDAVDAMVQGWPQDQSLGLIAYGHRRKGDCTDIEVLIPADARDNGALRDKVATLTPKGMTPITASVRAAAEALKFTEQKATVILVSDGEETCNADPCALGTELEELGIDFTANVIGFDLPEGKAREQLQCLAQNTGGRYIEARDANELNEALGEVAAVPVPAATPAPAPTAAPASGSIEAPEQATAGTTIDIVARGPFGPTHWVGFAEVGSGPRAYIAKSYERPTSEQSRLSLIVPSTPGTYELRYVLDGGEQVIVTRSITVVEAGAQISGPASVMAGDRVTVVASGPLSERHWIGFAPAGSDSGAYVNGSYERLTGAQTTIQIATPTEPGAYEYRYVLNESEAIAARQAVTVTPASARLEAPAQVTLGATVDVNFQGPRAASNWIGFIPVSGDGSSYEGWGYVPPEGQRLQLQAPTTEGAWELAFVANDRVIARRSVTVLSTQTIVSPQE